MDDEDEIVVACTAVVVCSLGAAMIAANSKKRKHSTWVKQYIRDRYRYDAYSIRGFSTTMRYINRHYLSIYLPEIKANDMS